MEKLKWHLVDFWWIYVLLILALSLIGWFIWYEYAYPCVSGHYEEQWQTTWCYNSTSSYPCGGYFADVFICDCRTVRDSIK